MSAMNEWKIVFSYLNSLIFIQNSRVGLSDLFTYANLPWLSAIFCTKCYLEFLLFSAWISIVVHPEVELNRYIGNTHHRGRLWDNRNHRQMMTVRADVSRWCYSLNSPTCSRGLYRPPVQNYSRSRAVYVFDDCSSAEGGICLWWGQANNPCSTVQALRGVSVFDQAVLLLPCWSNNHCPRPGLNVVIKQYWPSFPPPP